MELWPEVWDALAASPLAVGVRESIWIYPCLETLHVIGLALLVGSIFSFDLRLLGAGKSLPIQALGRHLLPWVWTGFAINAVTGALLFVSDAAEFAVNTALQAKLALIVLAGMNALVFQMRLYRNAETWDSSVPAPARVSAAISIALWLAIIVAGRMIAYIK